MIPEELLEAYYYKGLNKGESGETLLREIIDSDVKFRGAFGPRPRRGIDAVIDYFRAARKALSKYTFVIDDMVVSKDNSKASVRVTCRGIHSNSCFGVPGSGHEVQFAAAAFFQFSHTDRIRISEIYVMGDLDELKRQLGAPSETAKAFDIPGRELSDH
jgi:predicted ester cyclase